LCNTNSCQEETRKELMTAQQTIKDFGTLSVKNFALSIGKPISTIYSWKRNGNIPKECFMQIGRCIFVRVEAMQKFMNGQDL